MRLPALALMVRALRVDARSGARALQRMAIVSVLLIVLAMLVDRAGTFGSPGLFFFSWLVHLDFWMIALLGVAAFSGVLTEEKEAMTMGLLRLAGFDAIAILLGKSMGQLVTAALLLVVQLPFAMLSITLGGVTSHQVAAAFVVLLGFTLLVYGEALFASTVCRRSRTASRLTTVLLLVTLAGPTVALHLLSGPFATGGQATSWQLETLLLTLVSYNPYRGLMATLETGFTEPVLGPVVAGEVVVAAVAVLLAWLLFEPCHREEWKPAQARGWLPRLRPGAGGRERPRPGVAALTWKDRQFASGGARAVWMRLFGYALLAVALYWYGERVSGGRITGEIFARMMLPVLALLLLADGCAIASRVLHSEVKWKTLPPLLLLPMPIQAWLWAKVRGQAPVLAPIAALSTLTFLIVISQEQRNVGGGWLLLAVVYYCSVLLFAVMVAAYCSLLVQRGAMAITFLVVVGSWMLSMFAFGTCARPGTPEVAVLLASAGYVGGGLACYSAVFPRLKELGGR